MHRVIIDPVKASSIRANESVCRLVERLGPSLFPIPLVRFHKGGQINRLLTLHRTVTDNPTDSFLERDPERFDEAAHGTPLFLTSRSTRHS